MAPEDWATIVVGIKHPAMSQGALRWALEQARVFGKTLVPIQAYPGPDVETWPVLQTVPKEAQRAEAMAALDRAVDALGGDLQGVDIRPEVVEGRPVPVLVARSARADLLVLGSRRARSRATPRPISVASQCIQLSACPVVVVPVRRREVAEAAGS